MAGMKERNRRSRSQSPRKPQHNENHRGGRSLSVDAGATNSLHKQAREHHRDVQLKKNQNDISDDNNITKIQIKTNSDKGTGASFQHTEEDHLKERRSSGTWKQGLEEELAHYHSKKEVDTEEKDGDKKLKYHTAAEEEDEGKTTEGEGRNQETDESSVRANLKYFEELKNNRDGSADGETDKSGRASSGDSEQEKTERKHSSSIASTKPDAEENCLETSQCLTSETSTHYQTIKCISNTEEENVTKGRSDGRVPGSAGVHEETIHAVSKALSNPCLDGLALDVEQPNQLLAGNNENSTKYEPTPGIFSSDNSHRGAWGGNTRTSFNPGLDGSTRGVDQCTYILPINDVKDSNKSGVRKFVGFLRGAVQSFLPRNEEGSNTQLPDPRNLMGHGGEGSPYSTRLLESQNFRGPRIQLPIPENLKGYRWLVRSAHTFELGESGYSYEGSIIDEKMNGYGRLMLGKGGDFIAGYWKANRLTVMKFCQLYYKKKTFSVVKRCDDYLLTVYENQFVATVTLNSTDQLDLNRSTEQLKEAFFRNLTILEILQDDLRAKRQASLDKFTCMLNRMTGEEADPIIRASIFIVLRKCMQKSENQIFSTLLDDQNVPSELKNVMIALRKHDGEHQFLNYSFRFLNKQVPRLDLKKIIFKIYNDRIEKYREMLISKCPSALPGLITELQNLDNSKIVYVTRADVDVFDQLVSQPFFQQYKECFENLVKRFFQTFGKMTDYAHPNPSTVIPIMSPVFEFLIRSFWEIISEIIEATDGYEYKSMLKCEEGRWKIEENIEWPEEQSHNPLEENKSSLYLKALEAQYKLIFEMLKHVFPDNYILNKKFNYKFCVLENGSLQQERGRMADISWLQSLQNYRNTERLPERFRDLPEERLVWLYILDHTVHEVFRDNPKYQNVLKRFNPLLEGHIRFIENSTTESHESFRCLTHSIVKLVTSSAPYIRVSLEALDVDISKLGVDVDILFQHISTASQNIDHDPVAFSNFRDLITEYNKYLGLRNYIEIEAAPGYFSIQLSQIMQTFMRIVENSLVKSVPTTALVGFFRCLNDFLDDFRNIDFLAMWYVKTLGPTWENSDAMEKVDNKLQGKNCSYRVTNIEKFVEGYQYVDHPLPHHYIIQIVNELLGCTKKCLDKQWQSDEGELHLVQMKSTGILLEAIRRSFMYLKEQPDYIDFKVFKKESVDPFVGLVDECSRLSDLKTRADIVKESFWYLRKMDEIGIDQALTLLKDVNTCCDSDKLLNCYNLYLTNYNKYIEKYTSLLSDGISHSESLDTVIQMLKQVQPLQFSEWTEEFKTEEIPILLAGLSATWSILVSKDLSSTGKFLKPHCIQILCILRLLSVDQSKGIDNHLAQVLTGQGKSVILGLLSSVLALTGHKVRVLCYSEYLSSRDQTDFQDFFQTFRVTDKIDYGTFEDMANNFLSPTCNGVRKPLRQLVEERVLNHKNWSKMGCVTSESKNTVLLIDEVDVFFTEHFYGNTYNPCVCPGFAGLAVAQENVWSLAKLKRFTIQEIVDRTKAFIRDETAAGNTLLSDLNAFLSKSGTFPLLNEDGGNLRVKQYTNQTLFEEHLLRMASDALSVAENDFNESVRFGINRKGRILGRSSNDIYSDEWGTSIWGYLNTFNYFSLKGSNYDHKDFQNYGYFILDTGNISYSLLPSQFRLILGVSGTLKNLGEYEKSGIKSYNIHSNTILPSFYGESNLQFCKDTDFHYFTEEQNWLKKVYNKAVRIVQSNRAVLIFFESSLTINLFKKEYRTKFDRLNEITTNTEPNLRDTYIEEAGLPGAVTLATRGMGRGVDYKSSLSVEKHGGVHVIQTFYSADIKEEIQIKGRTARKDNKGSYEIVVCREHLVKENIIPQRDVTAHNYATLDGIRQKLSREKGITVGDKISKSERNHKTTMEYFGLA